MSAGGPVKDLTPGDRDVPPFSLGGPDDYAISPDSKEVCFAMNADPMPATSTNSDLFVVPIAGGEAQQDHHQSRRRLQPAYSPDGKYLAFRCQARAGYESDRWRLMVLERATGSVNDLTEALDRWVEQLHLVARFDAPVLHRARIAAGRPSQMIPATGGGHARDRQRRQHARRHAVHPRRQDHDLHRAERLAPTEIYRASSGGGAPVALTHLNDALLARSAPDAARRILGG